MIKLGNGRELISKAVDKRGHGNGMEQDFPRPGKSTDNANVKAFNGRFREAARPFSAAPKWR